MTRDSAADDLLNLLNADLNEVLQDQVEFTREQCVTLLENDMRIAKDCVAEFVSNADDLSDDQQVIWQLLCGGFFRFYSSAACSRRWLTWPIISAVTN